MYLFGTVVDGELERASAEAKDGKRAISKRMEVLERMLNEGAAKEDSDKPAAPTKSRFRDPAATFSK